MQHCQSPTLALQLELILLGKFSHLIQNYSFKSYHRLPIALTKPEWVLMRKNNAKDIPSTHFTFSFYTHRQISYLFSPAKRGISFLSYTSHSNTNGLSDINQLISVNLPHIGPSIAGYTFLSSDIIQKNRLPTNAKVAIVYLMIVPNRPGFYLESKIPVQEIFLVEMSLQSISGMNTQTGYY